MLSVLFCQRTALVVSVLCLSVALTYMVDSRRRNHTNLKIHKLLRRRHKQPTHNNDHIQDAPPLVQVRFYGEAQCPFCRRWVTDVWSPIWKDAEFQAHIHYDFVAWGNAYFGTDICGKGPYYDGSEAKCWATQCLGKLTVDDDDCFSGDPIYQHSTKEGHMDIYETCVKRLFDLDTAVAFMECVEGPKMDDESQSARGLMQLCLTNQDQQQQVQTCFDKDGRTLEIANAKATPPHPGVPYVVVNGKPLDDPSKVQDAICDALQHFHVDPLPNACQGSTKIEQDVAEERSRSSGASFLTQEERTGFTAVA